MICSLEKSGRWKAILRFNLGWIFFFQFGDALGESFNVSCEKDNSKNGYVLLLLTSPSISPPLGINELQVAEVFSQQHFIPRKWHSSEKLFQIHPCDYFHLLENASSPQSPSWMLSVEEQNESECLNHTMVEDAEVPASDLGKLLSPFSVVSCLPGASRFASYS